MKKPDIEKFKQNLKKQIEENPLLAIGIGAAAATSLAKLLDASTQKQRARTNSREIARREYQTYHGKRR